MLSPRRAPNLGKIRRRACLRLIPFPGTGDVLLAPTMISHPLAYVAPTTRQSGLFSSRSKKPKGGAAATRRDEAAAKAARFRKAVKQPQMMSA